MTAEPIAIIGMTCRFPDAPDIATFWRNLTEGHEAVRPLTTADMEQQGIDPALLDHPDYVNAGTVVENADHFDPAFFGYSPREAELMDPQHRVFLEECRKLLDIANLTRSELTIGAFAGCRQSTYQPLLPPIRAEEITRTDSFQQLMGNDKDYLVTRAAYKLNLTGPAMTVQTACSSSLVAVHQAVESLIRGECDAAIAGGVAISFPQGSGYFRQQGMIFSEDGHCRPFSADGTGIVAGNGIGLIALKRLADAQRDGDIVHAVILGSAVSNDGSAKIGYTAPGRAGQQRAIRDALARSGVSPAEIGMLEAHGTGTPLGDPVEIDAISEIYRAADVGPQTVAIGSVKGNVGHLDTAAGIASLIKAVLAVNTGAIPASLHCSPANPRIGFATTPFSPAEQTAEWPARFERRLAAISSFGIGGTNCHMIVGATEKLEPTALEDNSADQIFVWSAQSEAALQGGLPAVVASLGSAGLGAQCATAALRRQHFSHRVAVAGKTADEIKTALAAAKIAKTSTGGRVAFMFSGQGSQFSGMGAALRAENPVFRKTFETCLAGFAANGMTDLDAVISDPARSTDLDRTLYTQPALFSWQYAFAAMLRAWNLQPDLVFGHSVGEFAAAVTAGMLTLEDAIRLVSSRARLMETTTEAGTMLALALLQADVDTILQNHPGVAIAAINGPDRFSLSGRVADIDSLSADLTQQRLAHRRLGVNRAFHSATMEAIEIPFRAACPGPSFEAPVCDMLSTLTAELIEPGMLNAGYWYRQLRQPVRFLDTVRRLADFEINQVIEIGPDGSFAKLLTACDIPATTATLTDKRNDSHSAVIAALYRAGYETPLEDHYRSRHLGLATLPPVSFASVRIWPEKLPQAQRAENTSALENLLGPFWAPVAARNNALLFAFGQPLPVSAKPFAASDARGFLGNGTLSVDLVGSAVTASYRQEAAPALPDTGSTPLADWLAATTAANKTINNAWLSPQWREATDVRVEENRAFLSNSKTCVGWLDLGEPVAETEQMPVQLWRWRWNEVARLYQQKLSASSIATREDWLIVGKGAVADELAAMGRWIGHNVVRSDQPLEGSFSQIIDCRSLGGSFDFSGGTAAVTTALDRALGWLQHGLSHPACRITTLVSHACDPQTAMVTGPDWATMQLWRSLRNEHPHLPMTCVNIDGPKDVEALAGHLDHLQDLGTVLALRGAKLYEPAIEAAPAREDHLPLDWKERAATLIAGFGAVGRELALWLVGQGCRHLVIILHRAPDAAQSECIAELRAQGVTIHILSASLTDADALRAAINGLGVSIGQVFHTAHAGGSALLSEETTERFATGVTVKIEGSLALYRAVSDQPLALFCLFSSAASLLAMPGAAYNVANAWQDAFAQHLRNQGVPAISIAWGQFAMDRRAEKLEQLGKTSLKPIPAATGFAIMNGLLKDGATGLVPISVDAAALAAATGGMPATIGLLRPLLDVRSEATEEVEFELTLDGLSETERAERIAAYLRTIIGKRLKFDSDALDIDRPLTEQGVDSLVFLELVHIINGRFALSLPPTAGYEHGTIAALATHIAGLTATVTDDIDFSRQLGKGNLEIIDRPDERFEPFPLTDLQQAFWVGRKGGMRLGAVSCHEYLEIDLDDLNVTALETAWNRLIPRHEMMRCVITPAGQQQILQKAPHYEIAQRDLTGMSEQEREATLGDIRERMSYQVFDPQVWPLFELTVSHLPGGIARIHLDMDLLVFDIQSFRVVFGELATLLANPNADLPKLSLSFRDYVLAEDAARQGPQWEKAKNFWLEKLDTFPLAPELPLRRKPEDVARPTFRTLDHRLSSSHWKQFQARATERGLTASGALLTAFTQVLSTYSKAPEFTLNVTYFNRKNVHRQVMDICGDFTSLMLLPVEARTEETFIDAAKRTQNDLWQALAHREFNGIRLMRELGRQRNAGADGIDMPVVFTSMIGMDFDDPNRADWPLTSRQVFQINQTPQVWLDYQATEYGGALVTRWFIADDLFEPRLIDGMFRAYTDFLQKLAIDDTLWGTLVPDMRPEADRLLADSTQTVAERANGLLMPDLLQRSADATPENAAILSPQGNRSHAQLRAQTNRLANHLIALGLKPSQPVAVVMPRQPDAVLSALAIQAAGGCYVPVNGDYENERLIAILHDLSPFAVLTHGPAPALPPEFLRIDLADVSLADLPDTTPERRQAEEDLAYIIYTSGTTGQPKGAMLDHCGPLNTISALIRRLDVTERDRTLSLSAFHHDMSVFDIYAMMATGGAIVLPDRDRSKDAMHWLDLVREHRPTIINAVPAFVSMLLDAQALTQVELPAPRHVMMGGDWIPLELARRLKTLWPTCEIHSIGGPTETAIVSAYYHLRDIDPAWSKIPYGRPLENQTCRILNTTGQDCPVGVVGEICTGGLAMSLGYWGDETRTAERYRIHAASGEKLFHTGDLGRLNPDGEIEIIGRIDSQLKISGMRIEPSEIEAMLGEHPHIADATVIYGGSPLKQLHGYFTASSEAPANGSNHDGDNGWHRALTLGDWACNDLSEDFNLDDYGSHFDNMELLSTWVMLSAMQSAGHFRHNGYTTTAADLITALKVIEKYKKLFVSWLDVLETDGYLQRNGDLYHATDRIALAERLPSLKARIAARATQGADYDRRIWSLYERCIAEPQALLQGRLNPLELMFEGGRTDFVESWYRENPVSKHFNIVAGETVRGLFEDADPDRTIRILEFGAGIGSVTHDILKALPHENFTYAFTDLSRYFFDNAEKMFADWPQMHFGLFDINHDPALQGFDLGSYDLVIGANVLHDAIDVNRSSRLVRSLLKPSGHLLLVEGTRNPRFQLVSLGFVEGLSHYEDERLETNLPMLDADRWQAVLGGAGFALQAALPKLGNPVERMNYHVILAQNAETTVVLDHAELDGWLKAKLPDYMVPQRWHQLSAMPLTLNGKVDRTRLQQTVELEIQPPEQSEDPLSQGLQTRLAGLWQEILGQEIVSASANFFVLGGDSLLMTRLSSLLQHHFGTAPDLASLLRNPLLKDQARLISEVSGEDGALEDDEAFESGVI